MRREMMLSPADAGRLPWCWGERDCTLFAADYVVHMGFPDPAAGIRGTYHDQAGAEAIIDRHGGIIAIGARLEAIGWQRVDQPADGDIGVVTVPLAPLGIVGDIPAIRAGGLWVCRSPHGQRGGMFTHKAIWRQS